MSNIAIIPARGGSKRLPRKNILQLGGVPLIGRAIKSCFSADVFNEVIVSTEDKEIAQIAEIYGARVHKRSEYLATDKSNVNEVCVDVLKNLDCETFCCIYATAALIKPRTIIESYSCFLESTEINCLMGVSEYNYSPFQALIIDDDKNADFLIKEYKNKKSQSYPKTRVSNGTIYWGRKESFLIEKTFYSKKLKTFDIPNDEVCDIDTIDDFNRLKQIFSKRNSLY